MKLTEIISSALLGTSAMTGYSYLMSGEGRENFREPQLLNEMIQRLELPKSNALGWVIHYKVGFGFAAVYHLLWGTKLKQSLGSCLCMGAVNGLVGVAIWQLALRIHPNPPAKDLAKFSRHLILAHIVFGAFTAFGGVKARSNGDNQRTQRPQRCKR